jgi:hypothetical protein
VLTDHYPQHGRRIGKRTPNPLILIFVISLLYCSAGWADESLSLSLPIGCEVGKNCFVQNYVDHDPSSSYRDFSCGTLTYDGHDGTDFRLPSMTVMRAGVAVLAVADGEAAGVRDGEKDISIRVISKAAVAGRECGNGVLLRHPNGWETQYCHLANGSVSISKGQHVKRGQVLGKVGLSGATEFPHLHLSVRHNRRIVDPFSPKAQSGQCSSEQSLWDEVTAKVVAYRTRILLNLGFADRILSMDDVENGSLENFAFTTDTPALVAQVRMIGLEGGDIPKLVLRDPNGSILVQSNLKPLDRPKAQFLTQIGRKRPVTGWPQGRYQAEYSVIREGESVFEERFAITLQPSL